MNKKNTNVIFLSGSWYQRKGVLDHIKSSLASFELSIYDETYSYEYVEQNILSNYCFEGVKRLYIIQNFPSSNQAKPTMINHFKKMLKNVPLENVVVVLDNIDFQGDSLAKYVKELEHGDALIFEQYVDSESAKEKLFKRFQTYGKTLNREESNAIVSSMGSDNINVDSLFSLVLKFVDYMGSRKVVTTDDVTVICSQSMEYIVWDLMNKLDEKNIEGALSLANKLVASCKDVKTEIMLTFYNMYKRYKLLLWANDLLKNGANSSDITQYISSLQKMKQKGMGDRMKMLPDIDDKTKKQKMLYSFKMVSNIFNNYKTKKPAVKCYNTSELVTIISLLEKSQLRIRETREEAELEIILRVILMAICKKIDVSIVNKILSSPSMILIGG